MAQEKDKGANIVGTLAGAAQAGTMAMRAGLLIAGLPFLGALVAVFLAVLVIVGIMSGGNIFNPGGAGAVPPPPPPPPEFGDGTGLIPDFCRPVVVDPGQPCSTLLRTIFEEAGAWAKVPAGVLGGVASIEASGIFWRSDVEVEQFSAINGTPPNVGIDGQGIDKHYTTLNACGATGPMQFLVDSAPGYPPLPAPNPSLCAPGSRELNIWGGFKSAVNIAKGFNIADPDARNIRNSIFGAAWKIKCNNDYTPAEECDSGNFTNYNYHREGVDWDRAQIDDIGENYHGSCGLNYCERVWVYYQDTKSVGSGGLPDNWPAGGQVTQGPYCFDPKCSHNGKDATASSIDIANSVGTNVYATQDGVVTVPEPEADGCGNYVVIFGAAYQALYCHLDSVSECATRGGFIRKGTYLGAMGSTGFSTGPHVHYSLKTLAGGPILEEEFNNLVPAYGVGGQVNTTYSGENCL